MSARAAALKNVTVIDHPLVQHYLARLRDETTSTEEFRRCLSRLATLMVYESTRSFPARKIKVRTPLAPATGATLQREVILVPILRAGLGIMPSFLELIPQARVGFIGLKRHEETLEATSYHNSLPDDLSRFEIILIDPMLATGGSLLAALDLLHERRARHIRLVNLVAAPEGIRAVRAKHSTLPIYTAAIDAKLNDRGYILPGLGDAGDRLFGV